MSVNQIRPTLEEVAQERLRQVDKWGHQNHPDGTGPGVFILGSTKNNLHHLYGSELADVFRRKCGRNLPHEDNWRDILLEEVFEAMAEDEPDRLREELIQVAAVACAWVDAIDRRSR
jgi:hypothetical protein